MSTQSPAAAHLLRLRHALERNADWIADYISISRSHADFPGAGREAVMKGYLEWLFERLKYRVPDSGPLPKSQAALQDAQRTLGIVRAHAAEWHIDPNRIGVLGFSAGAHLAAALSTHFEQRLYDSVDAADRLSCRPDFAVIVYPGYLAIAEQNFAANSEINPTEKTPPTFIVQAEDDPVHVENATSYFLQLKNAKVPAELHIYAEGGHGYGLRKTEQPVTLWPKLVEMWLHTVGVLK